MKFSLIMATYGRDTVLLDFFESLKNQDHGNFELIVVDQNPDDRVEKICERCSWFEIKYFKTDQQNLSHARNIGLKHASGDIIAFPDDDCTYPPDLLSKVNLRFVENPEFAVLTGTQVDTQTRKKVSWSLPAPCIVTKKNMLRTGNSIGLFVKADQAPLIRFDEQFGIGGAFGSAEESDYRFRLLTSGLKGYYCPSIEIYHLDDASGKASADKYYSYSLGLGAYFKKHLFWGRQWSLIGTCLNLFITRPIGGMLVSLIRLDLSLFARYKAIFMGRLRGFIAYNKQSYTASKRFD
jgi:glycosyltransferase involved in cell wall biosynthesis